MLDGESFEFAFNPWIDKSREDPPWRKRHQVTCRLAVNLSTVLNRQHAPFSGTVAGDQQLEP
jgi:hypothetical protein